MAADIPPYGIRQGGDVVGSHVDTLREMARRVGHDDTVTVLPWARALAGVKDGEDRLLAFLSRTPAREADYSWVVPVLHDRIVVFSYGDAPPVTEAELASGAKSVVVLNNSVQDDIATTKGWPDVVRANTSTDLANLLAAGRVDSMLYLEALGIFALSSAGHDPTLMVPGAEIAAFDVYIAGSKNLTDADLAPWRDAFAAMRADGSHSAILARYGLEHLAPQ